MNLEEALIELSAGKKLRRQDWARDSKTAFIKIENDPENKPLIVYHDLYTDNYPMDFSILASDGWHVVKILEDGNKEVGENLNFPSVLKCLASGSRAYLPHWAGSWIEIDKQTKEIVIKSFQPRPYQPSLRDFLSEDWEVIN